ncbi:MAG: molybdenum cofactor guanylyltransferase [Candidatus Eremiobacteraeota bacterium]|nr:molybdenum cofactor guanylyltransferase [Candidatus Eremiobacteraeota bacterium]
MDAASAVSIILLAGGRASRLPGKLSLRFHDEPLLVHVFGHLTRGRHRPCIISVRSELPAELRAVLPVPMIHDRYEDCGPLGGLLSAAAAVKTPLFFAAAGDLPFVGAPFIDRLEQYYEELSKSSNPAPVAVVPRRKDGRTEPLAALYETAAFVEGATAAIARGDKRVTAALAGRPVVHFELSSEAERELTNINTAEDWQRMRA